MEQHEFRTFSTYMNKEENLLTASMEDYLEMIHRLAMTTGYTRIHELSEALNVHPPSATRMVQRLGKLEFLQYEKYGVIVLTEKGKKLGELLLSRHQIIESFLKILGVAEDKLLKETEKVEHTVSEDTISCIQTYIAFLEENPEIIEKYKAYKSRAIWDR